MTKAAWDIPQSWAHAQQLVSEGGTFLLIGGLDSGKSTLATILTNTALSAGRTVAVIDADVGQSHIGPPACVSVGQVTQPISSLADLPAARFDFVGSPSPVGHLLGMMASTQAMMQFARETRAETIITDSTGLISGAVARALKAAKVRLLDPDWLIVIQSDGEVEPLLAPYRARARPKILRLAPSPRVQERSRAERAAYRQRAFATYFTGSQTHALDWKRLPMENTFWTTGEPLPGHLRAHAEALLETEVRHAERSSEGILLITAGSVSRGGVREVEETFGSTRIIEAAVFDHLLVGMLGACGETLALGIVESINFSAGTLALVTPLEDPTAIRALRNGFLQVARDGTQLAWLNAGDLG